MATPDSSRLPRVALSVVIVNWNVRDLLLDCLASVYQSAGSMPVEVIVVDNASRDGSADAIAERFPQVRLIRNAENVFFSRGNNQGARIASGRHILFLNPDTRVLDDALRVLVSTMDAMPMLGVLGAKVLTPELRWSRENGYRLPTLRTVINDYMHLSRLAPWPRFFPGIVRSRDFSGVDPCEWVCAAALLVRREVFAQEQWNEGIFLFAEEVEYCERIARHGWKIAAVGAARVVHYSGQSLRQQEVALPANKVSGLTSHIRTRQGPLAEWLAVRIVQGSIALRSLFHMLRYRLSGDELARDKAKRLRQYLSLERGKP
jgi:GT2 family glycosyltransferase